MQGYKIWGFALALFLIGGGLFLYKWRGLGYPLLPEEETRIWTVEVTFDAPTEPGEYVYLCSFPGHYAAGMKGLLVVK